MTWAHMVPLVSTVSGNTCSKSPLFNQATTIPSKLGSALILPPSASLTKAKTGVGVGLSVEVGVSVTVAVGGAGVNVVVSVGGADVVVRVGEGGTGVSVGVMVGCTVGSPICAVTTAPKLLKPMSKMIQIKPITPPKV